MGCSSEDGEPGVRRGGCRLLLEVASGAETGTSPWGVWLRVGGNDLGQEQGPPAAPVLGPGAEGCGGARGHELCPGCSWTPSSPSGEKGAEAPVGWVSVQEDVCPRLWRPLCCRHLGSPSSCKRPQHDLDPARSQGRSGEPSSVGGRRQPVQRPDTGLGWVPERSGSGGGAEQEVLRMASGAGAGRRAQAGSALI